MAKPIAKKHKVDCENRVFQECWESDYLFIENNGKPVCLQVLCVPKEFNLSRHYKALHEEKFKKYCGESRVAIISEYKKKLKNQTGLFTKWSKVQSSSIATSYAMALELAKSKKPFSDGTIVKKMNFETVSLSHQTVARRIANMDDHVSTKLYDVVQKCRYFSLSLDESTDHSDVSQLLIFIRTIQDDFSIHEELLKLASLHGTTKGVDFFDAVQKCVNEYGGFGKSSCIVTDGAKAMVGSEVGLSGLLKKKWFHCISHQESLCGKSVKLAHAMKVVVKVTNFIRDRNWSLSHHKFQAFLEEIDAAYGDLLLHSEIHWLSTGKCLVRFFGLRREIPLFLRDEVKTDTIALEEELQNPGFLCELAFSCEELAEELQHFEGANFSIFSSNTEYIFEDFNNRFRDFETMKEDFSLFNNPLGVAIEHQPATFQLELCDLQADSFLNTNFFKILSEERFPKFKDFAFKITSMFGSTYICESTFSTMKYITLRYRSSLTDESLSHLLQLATTETRPELKAWSMCYKRYRKQH
uniref:HAT C-terminal dimerisation domain-containing protein n=1 Tax=Latimeria chalumnae TaxID=7897 RepID=H2ZWP1_LATCH